MEATEGHSGEDFESKTCCYASPSSDLVPLVIVPRFFTVSEAERLLPKLEPLLRSVIRHKREYEQREAEIAKISARIALTGGMLVAREQVAQARTQKELAIQSLKELVEKIQSFGCELKDADIGLIDFPTLYHDREVYLCWKLGESGIRFWHYVEDGYRGRKPIDSEFLANHRGDPKA